MDLKHFIHDHELILCRAKEDDEVKVSCYGCQQPILGLFYGCVECRFFLHKTCAEYPQEMTHPHHPDHTLNLQIRGTTCDVCGESLLGLFYHCKDCNFNVDLKCASIVNSLRRGIISDHPYHPNHQLIPIQKNVLFECDACGTEHKDASYICTTCGILVSQNCANSLPKTIQLVDLHSHTLTLIYSIPCSFYPSYAYCKICHKRVGKGNCYYCCFDCKFWVHKKCVPTETLMKSMNYNVEIELPHLNNNQIELRSSFLRTKGSYPKFIYLPKTDESVDVISKFIMDMGLKGEQNEEAAAAVEIRHVSHDHPLSFCDDEQIKDNLPPGLMKDEISSCYGCAQSISGPPFYYCAAAKCNNFFLHKWCTELTKEVRHPCHPQHPLPLTTHLFRAFQCDCCGLYRSMFKYGCSYCALYLDVKCAFLPHIIKHEGHMHVLALRRTRRTRSFDRNCSACGSHLLFGYACDPCSVELCVRCVLLPSKVSHRYDEHSFSLIYYFLNKDQMVDKDYCAICEEEIDPKFWYYHCHYCDQSLHTYCVLPIDENENVHHRHSFISLRRPRHNTQCGQCKQLCKFRGNEHFYECQICKLWLHERNCFDKFRGAKK